MNPKRLVMLATLLLIDPVFGQTPTPAAPPDGGEERVVYQATFYAPFAPRTALDMVRQTPGFALGEVKDTERRRGFAGAVSNVLVDGERLSAKSQSVDDVLQRIPAAEVVRVEILRGSEVAGDASGAAVLANVVRTPSTGGGAWGLGFELANQDEAAPNGWFGWGGRHGVTEYSLGGSSYALQRDLPGERRVFDADGDLTGLRRDVSPREFAEYALNGQVARPQAGGKLTFTAQAKYSRYADESELLTTTPAGTQVENELIPYAESDRVGEAGLTFQRIAGRWDLEIAALATRKQHHDRVSLTRLDATNALDSVFAQRREFDSGESIVRGTIARPLESGRLEFGIEAALNTLDGASERTFDFGTGPFPIPLQNANLRVKENRGEAFASHAWSLGERWSLESRLAAEVSRLTFTGDTDQSVSLSYLKPRLQLTRRFGAHQLQVRVFRDVGQLDFTDFISSVEAADDVVNGGNPDLVPQTAWAAEIDADFRYGQSAARVRLFHHRLDDVADFIRVESNDGPADAPGNIGRGTLLGAEVSLRLPLGRALPGGSLSLSGTFQDSEVTDPLTGRKRRISELADSAGKAELRQDLNVAKVAWGLTFAGESAKTEYRVNVVDERRMSSSLDAFVETTWIPGFKVRLAMVSLLGDRETRARSFYAPDRAGTYTGREVGSKSPGHWWLLTVTGGF
jgi:hypothetical protein